MRSSAASPSSQTHDTTPVIPTASLDASKLEEKFAAVNGDFTRGVTIKGKDDAMKLQGKVNDWRDDVSTLATHIAAQLQFCKSLRTSKAMALIPNTTPGDSDSQFVMAKGDMVSKIADDFVSKKKEVDMNNGIEDELVLDDHSATSILLSRDTKLFTKLLDTFQLLYKESRKPSNTQAPQSGDDSGGLFASTTAADSEVYLQLLAGAKGLRMDEANFTIQKKTCDDVVAYDKQKSVVADERDILGQKLHDEVKKISILNLMCVVLKREVSEKGAAIDTLRGNIVELQTGHEERMLEKTKRHEEALTCVHILDGKLRAAHDRISRFLS
ncbi:hypothetical protein DYB36_000685 [Aphanomyces astaci]|uniref:Uncharacterized protein n=1 Tax=Aphanomyces astaci TaxID=112090 RepID=A0A397AV83_APHAT|nr:hypothetical protein DYB36_000685 [Aphanomyces astaci]